MGTFLIRVVDQRGRPFEGIRVSVDFGIWYGQSNEYTDSNGWAEFDNLDGKLVSGQIFVDSKLQGEYSTYNGETYSFTI
jgi:hypothetical protein